MICASLTSRNPPIQYPNQHYHITITNLPPAFPTPCHLWPGLYFLRTLKRNSHNIHRGLSFFHKFQSPPPQFMRDAKLSIVASKWSWLLRNYLFFFPKLQPYIISYQSYQPSRPGFLWQLPHDLWICNQRNIHECQSTGAESRMCHHTGTGSLWDRLSSCKRNSGWLACSPSDPLWHSPLQQLWMPRQPLVQTGEMTMSPC